MSVQYLFFIHIDEEIYPSFCIVEENFWNENKCLDDQELGDLNGLLVGEIWCEDQEAIYSYWNKTITYPIMDPNVGRKVLLDLGLKEIPESEWSDAAHPL